MMKEDKIFEKIKNKDLVIFLDECAAGVLCFDLFVCGVVIKKEDVESIKGLTDSKKLSEKKRALLFPEILEKVVDYEIVRISPEEVDLLNIFQARMEGFRRAIEILAVRTGSDYAVIDGNKKPDNLSIDADCLVKADLIIPGVSCASIVAKHSHTQEIYKLSSQEPYSLYGLDKHKGYGTKVHIDALKKYGPIPGFHRYSHRPVKENIK